MVQCGHELKVFGFKLVEWGNRWYSNSTYCDKVQNLFRTGFFVQNDGTVADPIDDDFEFTTNDECTAEVVEMVTGRQGTAVLPVADEEEIDVDEIPTVTYSEVVSTFSAIASHAQNDQPEMVKLHAFAKGVLKAYQKGLSVHPEFTTDGKENQIPTATSKVLATASKKKQCKSGLEVRQKAIVNKRAKVGAATTCFRNESNLELDSMVGRAAKGTKKCSLCSLKKGHTAFTCDLLDQYGKSLPRNDMTSRMSLISDLVNNQRFVVDPVEDQDTRHTLKSLPNKVGALVLHRKCRLGREIVIETTVIRNGCVDDEFTCVLFKLEAITGWLAKSKAKPVVTMISIERFNPSSDNNAQLSQELHNEPSQLSQHLNEERHAADVIMDLPQQAGFSQSQPQLSQGFTQFSQNSAMMLQSQINLQAALSQQMQFYGNQVGFGDHFPDAFRGFGGTGFGLP